MAVGIAGSEGNAALRKEAPVSAYRGNMPRTAPSRYAHTPVKAATGEK
jgi:hypothetical protein